MKGAIHSAKSLPSRVQRQRVLAHDMILDPRNIYSFAVGKDEEYYNERKNVNIWQLVQEIAAHQAAPSSYGRVYLLSQKSHSKLLK